MRGAEALVSAMQAHGVKIVFALSGNQIMPVFDELLVSDIRIIHVRHEAAAVYMAEAYAQITGNTGVALVSAGSGLGNVIGSLIAAQASDTQLIVLSGDSPTSLDGRGAFQEMDQVALTQSLIKGARRVMHANDIHSAFRWAIDLASSGRTGPVHLALPEDILTDQSTQFVTEHQSTQIDQTLAGYTADKTHTNQTELSPQKRADTDVFVDPQTAPSTMLRLANDMPVPEALYIAQRPLIILGPSLSPTRAPGLEQALSEKYQTPALAMQSPRGLNDPSHGRIAEVARVADYVLCLGKSVDFTLGFGNKQYWPKVERWDLVSGDEAQLAISKYNLGERLGSVVTGDPLIYARLLAHLSDSNSCKSKKTSSRASWMAEAHTLISERIDVTRHSQTKITPHMLCEVVQKQMNQEEHAILVCDGGEFGQWAQACSSGHQQVINGMSGVIGGGIAHAIGAKAANPDSTVFSMMGDGTVGFHLAEFETAVREKLPFIAVVGNDNRWNTEHLIQERDYCVNGRNGYDLSDSRYDLVVAALGGFGVYVTKEEELADALAAAVKSRTAACVNVAISAVRAPTFG